VKGSVGEVLSFQSDTFPDSRVKWQELLAYSYVYKKPLSKHRRTTLLVYRK